MTSLARAMLSVALLIVPGSQEAIHRTVAVADLGSISGVVRDGDGKGLAGASVTLTSHSATSGLAHATSGPAGEYRFGGLGEGEYSLGAEMAGYSSGGNRVVQVTPESNNSTVDLVLIRTSAKPAEVR